ncbi:MAG: outer membrane protein assembly factor BamA [Azospirillaceae bacterium]
MRSLCGRYGDRRILARIALVLAAFAVTAGPGRGADAQTLTRAEGRIADIAVEGVQRIEPATVRSYLTVRAGDPFDPQALDDSLKSLFRTGLFQDVVLRRDGDTLVVDVVENPIINRIAFEGNRRIDDEQLSDEVQLRPRVVYTRTRVQNDVQRLLEVYRRSGRFAATIEPKIIELDQNRVDLVFEIDEGPLTEVQRISFVGNRAFSDGTLRGQIRTTESRFWRIFSTEDTYDPDRLEFDRELLRRFYFAEGYADFRVVSAVAELTPDRDAFFITFTIDEGERYRFGEIDLRTSLPDLDPAVLESAIASEEGDWYSSEDVEETVDNLTEAVGNLQYAFVEVRPRVTRNRTDRLINVTYEIDEGPRVFVERIDITGNLRTEDRVIRREFELVEGDPFSTARLRQSERNVRDLGFFSRVDVETLPGSTPDQTVIRADVEEQSTGELSFGAGFSTSEGPLGDISLRERNLLGRGQDLSLSTTISGRTQEIDLSFTEPYFLGRDLSAGFDAFRITRDNQDESSFDEFTLGFGLRLGYPLGKHLRQTLGYRLSQRRVEDIDEDASRFIQEQEGETLTSLVSQQLTYNRLDSRIEPTEGFILRLGNEVAGLGGDVHYASVTAGGSIYFTVLEDVVLSFSADGGYIVGLGEDVRINDRFFVGGSNLRGFERAGIGPRDENGDSLGGNRYAVGSVEVSFPLGLPEELGLKGRAFSDVGTLGSVDITPGPGEEINDTDSLRASVGVGLSWASPFGPVRMDLAYPVLEEDFDKTEAFRFSFGTRF